MSLKYVWAILLVFIIVVATVLYIRMWFPSTRSNIDKILDFFELVRKKQEDKGVHGSYGGPVATSNVVQLYHWLSLEPRDEEQIVAFLNSKQGLEQEKDGWGNLSELNKGGWAVVRLAFVLLGYYCLQERPNDTVSLDNYFDSLDEMDWSDIMEVIYQSLQDPDNVGWWNPWGIAFAYPSSYYLWKGGEPPWLSDFFQFAKDNPETWIENEKIHQMSHLMYPYIIFAEPVPYLEEVLASLRRQQGEDGSWSSNVKETAIAVHALKGLSYYYDGEVSKMIQETITYMWDCFSEVSENGSVYAGFKFTPNDNEINLDDKKYVEYAWYGTMLLVDTGTIEGDTWGLLLAK